MEDLPDIDLEILVTFDKEEQIFILDMLGYSFKLHPKEFFEIVHYFDAIEAAARSHINYGSLN